MIRKKIETSYFILSGFTLLEMLIVVVIIAVIAGIAIPTYNKTVRRAKIKEAEAQLELIYDAEQQYYLDNGSYTSNEDELGLGSLDSPNFDYTITASINSFTATTKYGKCRMTINQTERVVNKSNCNF